MRKLFYVIFFLLIVCVFLIFEEVSPLTQSVYPLRSLTLPNECPDSSDWQIFSDELVSFRYPPDWNVSRGLPETELGGKFVIIAKPGNNNLEGSIVLPPFVGARVEGVSSEEVMRIQHPSDRNEHSRWLEINGRKVLQNSEPSYFPFIGDPITKESFNVIPANDDGVFAINGYPPQTLFGYRTFGETLVGVVCSFKVL